MGVTTFMTSVMEHIEQPQIESTDEIEIPADLTAWVPAVQLLDWIVETVEGLNWDNPELIDALRRQPDFEARSLLAVAAYAYLTGVFGSEEVVRLCSQAREIKPIRPKLPPLVEQVSAFRKLNRGIIHLVLVQVLSKVLKTQFIDCDEITVFPPGIRRLLTENAFERVNVARHMDRTAAA